MTGPLQTVEILTGHRPARSVIWMHGLGADGHDFEPLVPELQLPDARFVFPHAPVRPVTINGGMPMRAWFDLLGLDRWAAEDEAGIRASAEAIERLIAREIERGIPSQRIVLAGFSQGGAMALHVALRAQVPLAGVLALSAYLPLASRLGREKSEPNAGLPCFMAHGDADPIIPVGLAEASRAHLEAEGYQVDWHVYPMGHALCGEEVRDISAWLRSLPLPGNARAPAGPR